MKKKFFKCLLLVLFAVLVFSAISNVYKWIVSGKQEIKISTSKKAYTNSNLYVSTVAVKDGVDLETKTKLKLLDSKGKTVKHTKISYDGNNAIIKIPDVEPGNYYIEAKVSSKKGKDTVKQAIYISKENQENITITLDKGIYKPGDQVNFRALLTSKQDDIPLKEDVNICIYDGNDNKVYNESITSSEYGIVSGTFKLADEVNSGLYKVVVNSKSKEVTKGFRVNPYVTPKYEVKITPEKQNYLIGDTAKIDIKADYFFGEPVSNVKYEVYINNQKYKDLTADEYGIASIEYKIDEAKEYNIKVEAVDTSNYYVEATYSFAAGTDIFEIELLPEYGDLIAGEKNTIFVMTKTADGKPIKAYLTINSNNTTKQVATDENGIGKFTIDIEEQTNTYNKKNTGARITSDQIVPNYSKNSNYSNYKIGTQIFKISAENLDGEKIEKNIYLQTTTKDLLLSTNKVKYNQGEDINIKISSKKEGNKNIYFFKDNKLLKIITTDMSDTSVNLDDIYGLIDIIVTEENNNYSYYYNEFTNFKKTIFIKPEKALNIKIGTDKEEYKPGENITISVGTTDENDNNVESALLVSMLDNSILNLANNDLSIDNIKLALQDIKFTNELDAATLYASIIDDSSESALTTLLLRQDKSDLNISENILSNYEGKEKAKLISILLIIIIAVFVFIYLTVKFKLVRRLLKHIINVLIYLVLLISIVGLLIEEFFWQKIDFNIWTVLITAILGLATYILWVSKLYKKIFRTSISIIITLIFGIVLLVLYQIFDISIPIVLTVLAVVILAFAIISKIEKLKSKKIFKTISKEILYIIKFALACVIAGIIGTIFEKLTSIYGIARPITIVAVYLTNYWINSVGKDKNNIEEKEQKSAKQIAISVLAIVGVMTIGYFVIKSLGNTSGYRRRYYNDYPISIDSGIKSSASDVLTPSEIVPNYESAESSSFGISSIFDDATNLLRSSSDAATVTERVEISAPTEEKLEEIEGFEATSDEDNIRNVFLESMCFIPEVIAKNGNAEINLKLSDNITTWTIQTVGNTKDGKIGYGSLDTVKVFKEFFVDFELPSNLVLGDKISIPVTVYNYTDEDINTILKINEEEWFTLEKNNIGITIPASSSKMVYVPIEIIKNGNYKLRMEVSKDSLTDIIEKEINATPNGYKIEKVVSSGVLDEDIEEDILLLEETIENTNKAKVKIYASNMAQNIEGMENIFKMPTGCFEQISSSLYPNILALKYLEDNGIVNDDLKQRALQYISSGYQKLLTYEVPGESGGYSLYGNSPAETVLTAYGLMELTDLKEVYNVDESVLKKMTEFLYKKQNLNGSFTITGYHVGGAGTREELALNAYITWALSETDAKNPNLSKSVEYLKGKLDKVNDNYTLALIANVLANVNDKEVNTVIKRLVNNVNVSGKQAYITSNIVDYYGARYDYQTMQTVSLTSMALSKTANNEKINKQLINYIVSKKDTFGTWYSTQGTILALKALNEYSEKAKIVNQTIKVSLNSDVQEINIKDNQLEIYELTFNNLNKENKLKIDIEKGNAYYEIIEEYYIPYDNVKIEENKIDIQMTTNNNIKVNEILTSNITLTNKNEDTIRNGMVVISIPAGCEVLEESLMLLETKGIIEKYEMNYRTVNLYLRDFEVSQLISLEVKFRARYPVSITGLGVRVYDYYNPNIEGYFKPINITVTE